MIYRGPGTRLSRRRMTLAPPPPISRRQVVSLSQSSCVSPVELTDGGGGVGGVPNAYDNEKAWTSKNHSILSGRKDIILHTVYIHVDPEPKYMQLCRKPRQFPFSCSHSIVEVIITRKSLVLYLHSLVGAASALLPEPVYVKV
jgi:hypothetical protein